MTVIAPSLLAADFANLANEVKKVEDGGADYLHLDVMDGAFVPNISFGAPVIGALRKHSKLTFDVHLMINDPIRYVDDFAKAGADIITFHLESCKDPDAVIDAIRKKGIKVGLAISPATPVDGLLPFLSKIDMALIMTVVPGFGGQSFMPDMLPKVKAVKEYLTAHDLSVDVQVDGGLKAENVALATEAGANIIVAGSAVFKAENPAEVISALKAIGNDNPYKA